MIVQCDQCNTRFKLDDAKVKEEGVKVRCSKCKHIFVVKKETPHEEAEFESILGQLGSSSSAQDEEKREEPPSSTGDDMVSQGAVSEVAETAMPAASPAVKDMNSWLPENIDVPPASAEVEPASSETQDFDFDRFNFEEETPSTQAVPPDPVDMKEKKDNEFDFGEVPFIQEDEFEIKVKGVEKNDRPADFDSLSAPECNVSWGDASADEDLPFVFDKGVPGGAASKPEENQGLPEQDRFGSFDTENTSIQKRESIEEEGAESFGFSSIDFATASPAETTPAVPKYESSAEDGSGRASHSADEFFALSPPADASTREDDLPPLSIASRRKGVTSAPIIVIAIAVVLVLALAGVGFYFVPEGQSGVEKAGLGFMTKWLGLETKEDGGVSIRNAKGSFVVNREVGELFVIRGEAVNNFRKPRASIQVRVVLYGPKGQVTLQKSAYCGNMLSDEQVTTLPLAKIEEAMNNQFGDSLSNLGVQPGKGIPFVVVLNSVPKDVAEFGVEVVGSTVASR